MLARLIGFSLCLAACIVASKPADARDEKPNVVIIMADEGSAANIPRNTQRTVKSEILATPTIISTAGPASTERIAI
ncbi:MAG: hypothetical protein VB876_15100, partial [Pirellulales bacterium]